MTPKDFMLEFACLLEKYGVEITASDEWNGYAECGEDIQMRFDFNYEGALGKFFDEIHLGRHISGDSLRRIVYGEKK